MVVDRIIVLQLILTDKEEKNTEDKDFIKELKKISTQVGWCFIVFDKKDITLKINIDKVQLIMPKQKFYSKVDAKISYFTKSNNIISMLEHIPKHLELRLEADYIDQIIKLMISKTLIEKLIKQGTKFVCKGIEIEPRIIESKMDEDDLKKKVKEIEATRDRLNMDCDK